MSDPKVDRAALAEDLVDSALSAVRQGSLEPLVQSHPRAACWLLRHVRPLVRGSAGDLIGAEGDLVAEVHWVLRWAVTQLRPDRKASLDDVPADAWLHQPSWRPMLAVMCHARLAAVPDFPRYYRRHPDESPADNLCGLWNVDPSTFYRYLERGQRAIARLALERPTVPQRMSLRLWVADQVRLRFASPADLLAWHHRQASDRRRVGDATAAMWHALQAGDPGLAVRLLLQDAAVLAADAEVDALVDRLTSLPLTPRQQFDFWMARATLARTRHAPEHEEQACRQALALAESQDDDLGRGSAQCALGRCFEARDAERAFAYYSESLRCLSRLTHGSDDPAVQAARLQAQARIAYQKVRRNDPSAREVLEEASRLLQTLGNPDEQAALIEQCWAAYWRTAGDTDRAVQGLLRSLAISERLGDLRSVIRTFVNLMHAYAELKDLPRVESYAQRIFDAARKGTIEPELLISAHGNLSHAYTQVGDYDTAAQHCRRALDLALAARHEQFANLVRINLANALYNRFLATQDAAFEHEADELVAQVLRAPPATVAPSVIEEARSLKAHVLGRQPERSMNQLLDEESAAHLAEMSEIKRHRMALVAAAADPATQVEARLSIARAYLTIAAKERVQARTLIDMHGLQHRFQDRIDALPSAFDADFARIGALSAAWKQLAADVLDDVRRQRVLSHLVEQGSINKSAYAEVADVAPATASKHLTGLTERGLLQQQGKGPSTRYTLHERQS